MYEPLVMEKITRSEPDMTDLIVRLIDHKGPEDQETFDTTDGQANFFWKKRGYEKLESGRGRSNSEPSRKKDDNKLVPENALVEPHRTLKARQRVVIIESTV